MSLALAPRKVAKKASPIPITGSDAVSEPIPSTSAVPIDNIEIPTRVISASEPIPIDSTISSNDDYEAVTAAEEVTKKASAERKKALLELAFELESICSDWGLSRNEDLLAKFSSSEDGYVHLSNLLALPNIAAFRMSMSDIATSIKESGSTLLELDETGFKIRRMIPLNAENISETDWATRAFYFENLPHLSAKATTPSQVRSFLGSLLSTQVQTVRFPLMYSKNEQVDERQTNQSYNPLNKPKDKAAKAKERASKIPNGGGPYKKFCFAVLGDDEAVKRCNEIWGWEKVHESTKAEAEVEETSDSSSDESSSDESEDEEAEPAKAGEEDADMVEVAVDSSIPQKTQSGKKEEQQTPEQIASKFGLRTMPITEWNKLRASYLAYQRALTALQDVQPSDWNARSHSRWEDRPHSRNDRQSRNGSGRDSKYNKRERTPSPQRSSVTDWKAARDQTWAKESAAIEKIESTFPEGVVVFMKNLHIESTKASLKSLVNEAIQQIGGEEGDQVAYVDYETGLDSAHIRLRSAGAAVAVKLFFQDRGAIMMVKETDQCSKLVDQDSDEAADATKGPVEATILEGERERIYWKTIPLNARSSKPQNQNQRGKRRRADTWKKNDLREDDDRPVVQVAAVGEGEKQDSTKHIRFD